MEVHRRSGTRLIDAAIVLVSLLLIAWVGLIVAAKLQDGDSDAQTAAEAPQGGVAGAFQAGGDAGWRLAWGDEFDQARCPSPAKWSFEHGFVRNEQLQWYQPENASCRNGVLTIEARRERRRNPRYRPGGGGDWSVSRRFAGYTSASLTSKFSFTYGRAEALIRIDPRPGSWPTFWTLGTRFRTDPLAWPASGEANIMDYYGRNVLASVCIPKANSCRWSTTRQSLASLGGATWASRFHLWAMDWNAERIELLLDGRVVQRFKVADAALGGGKNPYVNQPAFLLLSQAIGGTSGGDPANTEFPVRLEVKYVRVYQHTRNPAQRAVD